MPRFIFYFKLKTIFLLTNEYLSFLYQFNVVTTFSRTSSGTFLEWLFTARADECEKITGALVTDRASSIVDFDTCERSTNIPTIFKDTTY